MRVLIAEDDSALGSFVRKGLEAEHYAVDISSDGEQARAMAGEFDYDMVVLDLNLPRLDGVAVLRFLRTRKPSMPILVLTGRNKVEDRVQCLDLGADDYLAKPFSFTELSARIRALLRRSHLPAESVLTVADLKLDRVEHRVERAGRRIELTSKEFSLLEYFMRNAGRRITRAMIIEHVWNLSFDTSTNVVDVYVNFATAEVNKHKMSQLSAAIQSAFQTWGGRPVGVSNESPLGENFEITLRPPDQNSLEDLKKELEKALAPEIGRHEVALRSGPDGLVISLREVGFFESGSPSLKANSRSAFNRMVKLLTERDYRIRIEGHTDNVPIHNAQFASNWELSTARATDLVRMLVTQYGFAPENLSAAGYAEFHPVASNGTDQGRGMNRRLDVVVLNQPALQATKPGKNEAPLPGDKPALKP